MSDDQSTVSETFDEPESELTVAGVPYRPQPSPISEITPKPEYRFVVVVERVTGGWKAWSPMLPGVECGGRTWQEAYTGWASGVNLIRNNNGKPKPLELTEVSPKDIPKATENRKIRVNSIS